MPDHLQQLVPNVVKGDPTATRLLRAEGLAGSYGQKNLSQGNHDDGRLSVRDPREANVETGRRGNRIGCRCGSAVHRAVEATRSACRSLLESASYPAAPICSSPRVAGEPRSRWRLTRERRLGSRELPELRRKDRLQPCLTAAFSLISTPCGDVVLALGPSHSLHLLLAPGSSFSKSLVRRGRRVVVVNTVWA